MPHPEEVTVAEAARRLGLTPQGVGAWAARPGAPARRTGTRALVRWPEFARWREAQLEERARAEAMPADIEAERARKLRAEAGLAELELAKAQGELVAIADYEVALARVLDRLTARLRAMPVRLSHLGPETEAAAEAEAERIVEELSRWDEDILDADDSPATADR